MVVEPVALYVRRKREKIKRDWYIERRASEKIESKSESKSESESENERMRTRESRERLEGEWGDRAGKTERGKDIARDRERRQRESAERRAQRAESREQRAESREQI